MDHRVAMSALTYHTYDQRNNIIIMCDVFGMVLAIKSLNKWILAFTTKVLLTTLINYTQIHLFAKSMFHIAYSISVEWTENWRTGKKQKLFCLTLCVFVTHDVTQFYYFHNKYNGLFRGRRSVDVKKSTKLLFCYE